MFVVIAHRGNEVGAYGPFDDLKSAKYYEGRKQIEMAEFDFMVVEVFPPHKEPVNRSL